MNKTDWLEYFEVVNERAASPEDIAAALAAGEFSVEETLENEIVDRPKLNYFKWLLQTLLHPLSGDFHETRLYHLAINFVLIIGMMSLGMAIIVRSSTLFFIVLTLTAVINLLFNFLFGTLASGLLKIRLTFFDMLKINYQAGIYMLPFAVIFLVASVFIRQSPEVALQNLAMLEQSGNAAINLLQLLASFGIIFLILEFIFALVLLITWGGMSGLLYRETMEQEGSRIDAYPWLVVSFVLIALLILLFLTTIFGIIITAILPQPIG